LAGLHKEGWEMPHYMTQEEYEYYCYFHGELSYELNIKYSPNPWIFQKAHQPPPQEHKFFVVFRNFDGTRHLYVTFDRDKPGYKYTFREKPEPSHTQ